MEKEQYLKNKKEGVIDIDSAWEFYVEKMKEPMLNYQQFLQIFPQFLGFSNMEKYFEHFDKKFNIIKVIKNNQLIYEF